MKEAFTIIEILIVLVIFAVLSTLAISQYNQMVEKSRGAEARMSLGAIRTAEAAYRMDWDSCTSTDSEIGIGTTVNDDFPGPAAANCIGRNYFWYNVTASSADGFTAVATRCTSGASKVPQGKAAYTVTLVTDFVTGDDVWTSTMY